MTKNEEGIPIRFNMKAMYLLGRNLKFIERERFENEGKLVNKQKTQEHRTYEQTTRRVYEDGT